jgi:hypothetical protein
MKKILTFLVLIAILSIFIDNDFNDSFLFYIDYSKISNLYYFVKAEEQT